MKKGFTLIEVLIVVIILGILATLALPQFTKLSRRARLAEGWAGLGALRTAQAVYYMEKDTYADAIGDVDHDATANFTYAIEAKDATEYTAYALGSGGDFAGMSCWFNSASAARDSGGV